VKARFYILQLTITISFLVQITEIVAIAFTSLVVQVVRDNPNDFVDNNCANSKKKHLILISLDAHVYFYFSFSSVLFCSLFFCLILFSSVLFFSLLFSSLIFYSLLVLFHCLLFCSVLFSLAYDFNIIVRSDFYHLILISFVL